MLTKQEMKACLAGEPTPVVPARMCWFDGKFIEKHRDDVEQMNRTYGDDFAQVDATLKRRAAEPELEPGESTDEWGCLFAAAPDGVGSHPTRPIVTTISQWRTYVAQGMPAIEPGHFEGQARKVVSDHPGEYVLAQLWRTFYERMYMLIGFENLMMEIAEGGELFKAMLHDLRDFTIRGIELLAQSGVDGVFLADDWGTQHRLQVSPATWRRDFKPAYAAMIDTGHSLGLDMWLHSCGHIDDLIPEWIELGLDVIAHLQPAALDLPAIARAYRGQITFFGGIDVQFNLVSGTRASIRDEVKWLMDNFDAHSGGYIAAPSNSIMPETPVENVWHMCEAIREFGRQ